MLALNIYETFYTRTGWEGAGQAKAVVFFIIVAVIAMLQNRLTRSKEVQQIMAKNKKADNQVSAVKTRQTRMGFNCIFLNPCGTVAVPDFPCGDEFLKEKRIHHEISVCTAGSPFLLRN